LAEAGDNSARATDADYHNCFADTWYDHLVLQSALRSEAIHTVLLPSKNAADAIKRKRRFSRYSLNSCHKKQES